MRLRTEYEDGVDCMPLMAPPSVLPNGSVWIAGSCGLRGRIDAAGRFHDYRAPSETVKFDIAGVKGSCPATYFFDTILARADDDVWTTGDRRCGLDPNTIWMIDPVHFDGSAWRTVPTRFPSASVHESSPDVLVRAGNDVFALALGDDWHGAPECGVYRLAKNKWVRELGCVLPTRQNDAVTTFYSIATDTRGGVWVAGRAYRGGAFDRGFVMERTSKGWVEHVIADDQLSRVAVGADGTVWAAGKSLWRQSGKTFVEQLSVPAKESNDLWVGDEVWLISGYEPYRLVGQRFEKVLADPSDEGSVSTIRGSGKNVWAAGQRVVWSFSRDGSTPEPITVTFHEPKR